MSQAQGNKLHFRLNLKDSWLKQMKPTLRKLQVKNSYHSQRVNRNSTGENIW